MLKECSQCFQRKPVRSEFRVRGNGHRAECKACEAEDKRSKRKDTK